MAEKRKRNQTLTIRLTEKEKQMIHRKAARAKRSLTDYIVALALETPINVAEDLKPLLIELKRIGNNINQITAKINSGVFQSYNFQDVIDMQKEFYQKLIEAVQKH